MMADHDSHENRISRLEDQMGDVRTEAASAKQIITSVHEDVQELSASIKDLTSAVNSVSASVEAKVAFGKGFIAAITLIAGTVSGVVVWWFKSIFGFDK